MSLLSDMLPTLIPAYTIVIINRMLTPRRIYAGVFLSTLD